MTLRDIVLDVLNVFVGEPGHWPHDAEVLAEDFSSQTDLTEAEAVVAAGDLKGLRDKDIRQRMAMSPHRIEKIRAQLRERYRTVYQNRMVEDVTEKTVKDWAEARS